MTLVLCMSAGAWAAVEPCTNDQMTFAVDGASAMDATDCLGWAEGVGANDTAEEAFVNGGWVAAFGGGSFEFVLKDEGSDDSGSFDGLNFTLSTTPGSTGTYELTWAGDLPKTLDLAFVAKASGGSGAFLFDDVTLTADPLFGGGTFEIGVFNSSGVRQSISHLTLLLRSGDDSGGGDSVPAPTPLLLMAAGIVLMRRRHSR